MPVTSTPDFLEDSLKFGIRLGLQRMEKLSSLLGDPQNDLKAVHIAGTNGKGSTSAFIASILAASGKKVGIFTSPFLERFSERMRIIDGKDGLDRFIKDDREGEIDAADLDRISRKVQEASTQMTEDGFEHPTEFELVTAIAFLWFKENDIDIAVLETGLGGRLDSTNIIESPLCTVITAIGMDHTDRLGDTIDKIAFEKAGIFKKDVPALVSDPFEMIVECPDHPQIIKDVMQERAREVGCPVTFVTAGGYEKRYDDEGFMVFGLRDELSGRTDLYRTKLYGDHQVKNAALAISACRMIDGVSEDDIRDGIEAARWKGRVECLSDNPPVVLDGGHNYQGTLSLVKTLQDLPGKSFIGSPVRLLTGVMADKDSVDMIRALRDGGVIIGELVAVKPSNPRSLDPDILCDRFDFVYNKKVKSFRFEDAGEGASFAVQRTMDDDMPLLVTGSLYLIGQVRGLIIDGIGR